MSDYLHPLLNWAQLNPFIFGLFIFFIAFFESLAIIGIIVPGVAIMFAIGTLISAGFISFGVACLWAVAGAIIGDGLSYWFGRKYADKMPYIWPFKQHPETLQQGIRFFHKNGGKSVAIGRFFGPLRAVIPLIAGMLNMPKERFLIANIASAILWAPLYLLPGVVFGSSVNMASSLTISLIFLTSMIVVSIWIVLILLKKSWSYLAIYSQKRLKSLYPQHNLLKKIHSIHAIGLIFFSGLLVLLLAIDVKFLHFTQTFNQHLLTSLLGLHSTSLDNVFINITRLADNTPTFMLIISATFYFVIQQDQQRLKYWIFLAIASIIIAPLIKYSWQITRPDVLLHTNTSYSFPSGHVLRATLLWGGLTLLLTTQLSRVKKYSIYLVALISILSMGVSRLYLGMHWFSDVVASLSIGLACLAMVELSLSQHKSFIANNPFRLFGLFFIFLSTWIIQTNIYHKQDQLHYQIRPIQHNITLAQWFTYDYSQPIDLTGLNSNPFNIFFTGDLPKLQNTLEIQDWEVLDYSATESIFTLLSRNKDAQPTLLPHIHAGKFPTIVFQKIQKNGRKYILRLWLTKQRLQPTNKAIWLGQISHQYNKKWLTFFHYSASDQKIGNSLLTLAKDLQGSPLNVQQQPKQLYIQSF